MPKRTDIHSILIIGAGPRSLARNDALLSVRNDGPGRAVSFTPPKGLSTSPRSTQNLSRCVSPRGSPALAPARRFGDRASWLHRGVARAGHRTGWLHQNQRAGCGQQKPLQDLEATSRGLSGTALPWAILLHSGFPRSLLSKAKVVDRSASAIRSPVGRGDGWQAHSRHLYQRGSSEISFLDRSDDTFRRLKIKAATKGNQAFDPRAASRPLFGFKVSKRWCHIIHSLETGCIVNASRNNQLSQMFFHRAPMRRRDLSEEQFGVFSNITNCQTCHDKKSDSIAMQSMYAMKALLSNA